MPPPTTSTPDRRGAEKLLQGERARAAASVERRRLELRAVAAGAGAEGRDDEHDPDGATAAAEQALASGLLAHAVAYLSEVELAIDRVAAGRYGRCEQCGDPISTERLAAQPAARACIRCASRPGGLRKGPP